MRMPLVVTFVLLGACASSSVPAPQPAPAPSGATPPAAPAPAVGPAAGPATARITRRALIASGWPLAGRAKPVEGRQAMVVSGHPLASDARGGTVVEGRRGHQSAREASGLAGSPASRAQFLRIGEAPPAGTRFVQAELAHTLELIADSGPKVFYRGQIAELLVREMERGGGLITRDDLARYRAKWRAPLQIDYRGYTIYTMPPPSGGGVTLAEILNTMEGFGSLPAFGSARLLHLQAEAMRRAYADRNAFLGDPDFVALPLKRLVSKSYAAELRAAIDPGRATRAASTPVVEAEEDTSTTHYSIVDPEGGAVSCTTTLNNDFGSAVTVTGAGFLLNDEMDDFATAPGKPNLYGLVQGEVNAIAPGKRMLSAMTPSIVLDPRESLLLVLGSPGGSRIPTAVYQVISNVIDQEMPLADAVAAPRLHHQALPDLITW